MEDRKRLVAPLIALVVAAAAVLVVLGTVVVPTTRDGRPATTSPPAAAAAAAGDALAIPSGPADATAPAEPVALATLTGGRNAAAVLAADEASAAVALRWLDAGGVPAVAAPDLAAAAGHAVIVVRAGVAVPPLRLRRLVARGAVLVAEAPLTPAVAGLAGLPEPVVRPRIALDLLAGGSLPAVRAALPALPATGWAGVTGAVARYPDGTAAVVARRVGTGVVVALGVPLEALALPVRAASDPAAMAARPGEVAVGARDAGAALARALHALSPSGVALGAAPAGATAALVVEHDLDDPADATALRDLVAVERDRGVGASIFVAAQWLDGPAAAAVLTPATAALLAEAQASGAELESGGVAPGDDPVALPLGTGDERAPGYAPTADGGGQTLAGEARVGPLVLAAAVPGAAPVAFRAARPGLPAGADPVLAAAGLLVDAAPLATDVGGGDPYPSLGGGEDAATTDGPLVLPLAVDDRMDARPDRAVERLLPLLPRRAALGATTAVRISPAHGDAALTAVRRLLAAAPDDVWTGGVAGLAAWRRARSGIRLDAATAPDGTLRVVLESPGDVPAGTLLLPFRAATASVLPASPATLSADGRRVALPAFAGRLVLEAVPLAATAA